MERAQTIAEYAQIGTPEITRPGVVVVGAGLAGLASAIRLRQAAPDQQVMIIEKLQPQSNTQIAGQRYRAGKSGMRADTAEELVALLASRNRQVSTPAMEQFATLAEAERNYWQSYKGFVGFTDQKNWFGPQWGQQNAANAGRGRSVLNWFKHTAQAHGVVFCGAEVARIVLADGQVEQLVVHDGSGEQYSVRAGQYVLANGSMDGRLYHSTNRAIRGSAHELAFEAGLELVDSTVHMIHPFGSSDERGTARLGCYETDQLAGVKVYLGALTGRPIYDEHTTQLLQDHAAHSEFPTIARTFQQHGSVVRLDFPDGKKRYARVAHHYGHGAIDTENGVKVKHVDNLYAVGDASGIGYWTNHRERLPGFALLKCLTDAALIAGGVVARAPIVIDPHTTSGDAAMCQSVELDREQISQLKEVNTEHLLDWQYGEGVDIHNRKLVAARWVAALSSLGLPSDSTQMRASAATAAVHYRTALEPGHTHKLHRSLATGRAVSVDGDTGRKPTEGSRLEG